MYEEWSDEQLLKDIRKEDVKILEILLERYNKYINTMIKSYEKIGIEKEELVQEATIGLYKAIKSYNYNKNTSFKTYATQCIKNELNTFLRKKQRKKNSVLEDAISLNNVSSEINDTDLLSYLADSGNNPLTKVIEEESNNEFKNSMKKILSKFEYNIFREYINGLNYIEIAKKINSSPKSIDNAIQRIKIKISNILN